VLLASSGGPGPGLRHGVGGGPGAPEPPWPAALRTCFHSLQASVQLGAPLTPPGAMAGAPPAEAPLVSRLLTLSPSPSPSPSPRPTLTLTLTLTLAQP